MIFCSPLPTDKQEFNDGAKEYVNEFNRIDFGAKVMKLDLFNEYQKFDLARFFNFVNVNGNPELQIKPGDLDFVHPNSLGNAYIAKVILREVLEVDFDPEKYIKDIREDKMYPDY